jgi:hypothetical protein
MYEDLRSRLLNYQHGFFKDISQLSQICSSNQMLSMLKSIESGFQVDSIYTDFSWTTYCCRWLSSYFSGGIQRIRTEDCLRFVVSVLWTRSLGSLSTYEYFLCWQHETVSPWWMVVRIVWIFRAIWTNKPNGARLTHWRRTLVSVNRSLFQDCAFLLS